MGDADDHSHRDEGTEGGEKTEGERRQHRHRDRAIPEILKRAVERAVETGVGKLAEGPDSLRNFVGDLKLPKEVLHYLYQQIDDTKNGLYRVVAKEIRDVLEHTNLGDELARMLTKLSFEIKTEIRFVPNDAKRAASKEEGEEEGAEDEAPAPSSRTGLPKPEVSAQVTVKDRAKEARRAHRRREGT